MTAYISYGEGGSISYIDEMTYDGMNWLVSLIKVMEQSRKWWNHPMTGQEI